MSKFLADLILYIELHIFNSNCKIFKGPCTLKQKHRVYFKARHFCGLFFISEPSAGKEMHQIPHPGNPSSACGVEGLIKSHGSVLIVDVLYAGALRFGFGVSRPIKHRPLYSAVTLAPSSPDPLHGGRDARLHRHSRAQPPVRSAGLRFRVGHAGLRRRGELCGWPLAGGHTGPRGRAACTWTQEPVQPVLHTTQVPAHRSNCTAGAWKQPI